MRNTVKHTEKLGLGIDVGDTHISCALVNLTDGHVVESSFCKKKVNAQNEDGELIIDQWLQAIQETLGILPVAMLGGIGFTMPGWLKERRCR